MRAMCLVLALCVVITTGVSNSALAGEALQWRIDGGGNGHWYQRFDAAVEVNWIESRNAAVSGWGLSGHAYESGRADLGHCALRDGTSDV